MLMGSTLSIRALIKMQKFRHCNRHCTVPLQDGVARLYLRFMDDVSAWILLVGKV